jgi:hypothetical protein
LLHTTAPNWRATLFSFILPRTPPQTAVLQERFDPRNTGCLITTTAIDKLIELFDRKPEYAIVVEVDLVVLRFDEEVSVFYGRCLHRSILISDGHVHGNDLNGFEARMGWSLHR